MRFISSHFMKILYVIILSVLVPHFAFAHIISITATTPFPAQVNASSTTTATYTVKNIASKVPLTIIDQSKLPNGLSISKNTCGSLMYPGQTCNITLSLQAPANATTYTTQLQEWASPSADAISAPINVQVLSAHSLGGTITGLTGTVVLQNSNTDSTSISTDGQFTFPSTISDGSTYSVTVLTQPVGQTCTVNNGIGTMDGANISNVSIVCSTNSYTVGGNVTGLSGSVTLQNNGTNSETISSNGSFTFTSAIAQGSTYSVSVLTQPANQTCTVSNGSGTMGSAPITNVNVTCAQNTYTVGGTVSGSNGTLIIQNNNTNTTSLNANGPFTFSTVIAQGSPYSVTVQTPPSGQICTVSNGSGVIAGSNITNVGIACNAVPLTTLSTATTFSIPASSSAPTTNTLTVTNTGANPAYNVRVTLPSGWTGVTQDASACTSIAAGGTCNLVFSSTQPYVAQKNIVITGLNISNSPTVAIAFSVQSYLVWAVSGATAQVVDSTTVANATQWGNNTIQVGTNLTNGVNNTTLIINTVNIGASAALNCYNSTHGSAAVGSWYLPAICQMSYAPGYASCSAGLANIDTNLIQLGFRPDMLTQGIASSSEYPGNPNAVAYIASFALNGGSTQLSSNKANGSYVRCARSITY